MNSGVWFRGGAYCGAVRLALEISRFKLVFNGALGPKCAFKDRLVPLAVYKSEYLAKTLSCRAV